MSIHDAPADLLAQRDSLTQQLVELDEQIARTRSQLQQPQPPTHHQGVRHHSNDDPPEIKEMREIIRKARRDYPRPIELDSRFLDLHEVAELRAMVEHNASETELDDFIRGEPNLLSSLLHFAGTGHHGGKVYPQQTIRPSMLTAEVPGLIPDYLISGENSGPTSWWVLELKAPNAKLFAGKGRGLRLSDVANKGLFQIEQYINFCKENQCFLRDAMGLREFSEPQGILLIGRESEFIDPTRRKMKDAFGGPKSSIRIRTWDSLLRSLEHKLWFYKQLGYDPLRGSQLENWSERTDNALTE